MAQAMHAAAADRHAFGFWVYLMTDLIIFGVLFAVYFVLKANTFGGPSSNDLFSLPTALANTLVLLTSSFTCGLATLAAQRGKVNQTIAWLAVTFVLGATFLTLELSRILALCCDGRELAEERVPFRVLSRSSARTDSISPSALLWIVVAIIQLKLKGLTPARRFQTRPLHALLALSRYRLDIHFHDGLFNGNHVMHMKSSCSTSSTSSDSSLSLAAHACGGVARVGSRQFRPYGFFDQFPHRRDPYPCHRPAVRPAHLLHASRGRIRAALEAWRARLGRRHHPHRGRRLHLDHESLELQHDGIAGRHERLHPKSGRILRDQ